MKASELRIGNLYVTTSGVVCSASSMSIENIDGGHVIANPIPLTHEWLTTFGLEKQDYRTKNIALFDEWTIGDEFCLLENDNGFEFYPYRHPIKYVHQLQNLYYAITGKELKQESAFETKLDAFWADYRELLLKKYKEYGHLYLNPLNRPIALSTEDRLRVRLEERIKKLSFGCYSHAETLDDILELLIHLKASQK